MMLMMTVMAAGAVFTWYQQFQQQQLQKVTKSAAALAKNIAFAVNEARWNNKYGESKEFDTNGDNTNDLKVTYVTFQFTITNSGDDMDLNSKNPLAFAALSELTTGTPIVQSSPGVLVVDKTNSLNVYPTNLNFANNKVDLTTPSNEQVTIVDVGNNALTNPLVCYRVVTTELNHPINIVASGETARFNCMAVIKVETSTDGTTWNAVDYSPKGYDATKDYNIEVHYGAVTQVAQIQ